MRKFPEFFAWQSASSRRRRQWARLCAGALTTLFALAAPTAEINGLLQQEVYIWQRTWNPAIRDSLAQHAAPFSRLVALNAEVPSEGAGDLFARLPGVSSLRSSTPG